MKRHFTIRIVLFLAAAAFFTIVPARFLSAEEEEAMVTIATAVVEPSATVSPELNSVDLPPLQEEFEGDAPLPVREPVAAETTKGQDAIMSSPRRFQYAFQLTVRGIYDDNINLNHVGEISDFYWSIDPVIVLAFGDAATRKENFVRFDYRPRIFFFAEHSDNDAIEHVVRLEGQYSLRRLKVHASQEVQLLDGSQVDIRGITGEVSSGVNLDVSDRTQANLFTTQVDASYDMSSKSFLTGGVSYVRADYPDLISSQVLSGNFGFNQHYSPKLDLGISGTVGVDDVDAPNPDQTFQQINGHVSYNASGKLTFVASGGLEFRQFENSGRDQYISPVFLIGATYQPFDGTSIVLNATRNTYNSAVLAGQNYTNTNVRFGVRQRVLRRFKVGLNAGFQNSEYFSTIDGVEATRDDNYFFVQPAIDVTITRFWTIGAFYLYRRNNSSAEEFGFRGNQFGVQSTLTF